MGGLMFDGIVFDMDGVLFDTENVNFRAWQKASAEMGHPYISDHYPECIGRTRTDDIQLVRRLAGEDFPVDEFFARTSRYCRELMEQEGVPVKPGVEDILRYLQERNIPVALASSTFRDRVMMRLDSAGFTPYFRCITAGDEVSQASPAPRSIRSPAANWGCPPTAVWRWRTPTTASAPPAAPASPWPWCPICFPPSPSWSLCCGSASTVWPICKKNWKLCEKSPRFVKTGRFFA